MKKECIYFYIFLTFVIIESCSNRELIPAKLLDLPDVQFSISNDSCVAPCAVRLNRLANNTDTVKWELGDGASAIGNSITHVYETAGNYTVKLTVTSSLGISNDTSILLSILASDSSTTVQSSFNQIFSSNNGVAPDSICFLNSSSNATSFQWDFGDGSTANNTEDTVCHVFDEPGEFKVQLIALTDTSADTSSIEIIVHENVPLPIAQFEVDNDSCIAPCSVELQNTSLYSDNFLWDFGNGDTFNNASKFISYEYTEPGNYEVSVTARSALGSHKYSKVVTILGPLPIANFRVENDSCFAPCALEFFNNSQYEETVKWEMGDGAVKEGNEITHNYDSSGRYRVILIVENASGIDTASQLVTVLDRNNPCYQSVFFTSNTTDNKIGTPSTINFSSMLEGENIQYSWDFGNGKKSTIKNPINVYAPVAQTQPVEVTLTVEYNDTSCSYTETLTLYNGPIPGETRLSYINSVGKIVHTSPISPSIDSSITSSNSLANFGTILDMAVDYTGRKIYVLTGEGDSRLNGGRSPKILACNPNGTDLTVIYEGELSIDGAPTLNDRVLSLYLDQANQLLLFIEKNKSVNNQYILKAYSIEDAKVRSLLIFKEASLQAIDQFFVRNEPRELYYHLESGSIPSIKRHVLPPGNPQLPAEIIDQKVLGDKLYAMEFDPNANELYVHNLNTSSIEIYNLQTKEIVRNLLNKGNIINRIALPSSGDYILWLEVINESAAIKKFIYGEISPSTYTDDVNKNTLELGTFH